MTPVGLGQKYGKLTTVKRWPFRYRAYKREKLRWSGQPMWLVVCDCGEQFTIPEGKLLEPPYTEAQACRQCQPHVRMPALPQGRTRHLGHALVDQLLASMEPMEAYREYLSRTHKPVEPTSAQRRALRVLAAAELGLRPSERTLGALERLGWYRDGALTEEGLRLARESDKGQDSSLT